LFRDARSLALARRNKEKETRKKKKEKGKRKKEKGKRKKEKGKRKKEKGKRKKMKGKLNKKRKKKMLDFSNENALDALVAEGSDPLEILIMLEEECIEMGIDFCECPSEM